MSVRDELLGAARDHGFCLLGVADPVLFDRYPAVKSVSSNEEYMRGPLEAFPGCKSVVVAGIRCDEPVLDTVVATDGLRATFYHELVFNRLHRVRHWIEDRGGRAVPGPISLKRAAVLAGLGQVCRNTLVAAPGYGSAVRWGALLTDLELPFDEPGDPFDGHAQCEDCRRCADACPAGAVGDYSVDFGKCVVPAMGLAPPGSERWRKAYEVQRRMGPRSHQQCTICQTVCPLNRDAALEGRAVSGG